MKKSFVFLLAMLWAVHQLYAQIPAQTYRKDLPEIAIGRNFSLHFISPQPIQYVDISTNSIAGDLPLKNVLRLKILPDSTAHSKVNGSMAGIVTIVGESFIAQYNLVYTERQTLTVPTQVDILPEHTRPLDVPGISLTSKEMKDFAMRILREPAGKSLRKVRAFGLKAKLNHVYTAGDHIFLDITYYNTSNLPYQIDEQRFKIEDKKIAKATNVQSVEIDPVWQLYPNISFKRQYRNIYVLKKATFPGNKVLNIELTEKQISGRVLTLQMKYKDILMADSL
ncbi:MAG: conjugative transposon protein TraN [Chryseobacterium sp.]|nr:MAG: conjugative transposon protein TraN [Chryseobacterium sp.]